MKKRNLSMSDLVRRGADALTAPDLLVRPLSLHCQLILCKGAGNFQSIIPHIRSFLQHSQIFLKLFA
jgi:hypothetical protein